VNTDDRTINDADLSLGCLSCTIQVSALKGFKCNPILRELGEGIRRELDGIGAAIGQIKMTLAPDVDVAGVATLSFTRNQPQLDISPELDEPVERGRLDLLVRAEAKPDHLHAAVTRAMNHTWGVFPDLFVRMAQMENFGPFPTSPTQRVGIQ
jgi:hypothetical protein